MSRPIHETIARRWRLVRLASQAGAGAVVGSGLALAWGAGPWPHLASIVVAAAAAAAWPARGDERRALRWVAERSGLAYETAWEHARGEVAQPTAGSDPAAALRAAVAVQGRLSVRDLRPPPVSAWWLPLLTLAIGMWAWSLLSTPGGPSGPWAPPPVPTPSGPSAPGPVTPDPLPPEEAEDLPVPPPDPQDAAGAEPGADDDGDGGAGAAGGGSEGVASEREALERFLENLRERPQLDEEEQRAAEAALAEPSEEEGDAEPEGEAPAQPGEPRSDGDREAARDGEEPGEGEEGVAVEGGEEGPGEGEGEEAMVAGGDDAGDPGEEGGDPAGDPGEEGPGGPGEGDADGAGLGVGAEAAGGDGVEAGAEPPEALPSILGAGPEQAVGGVQLPGTAPEGEVFPVGAAGTDFRRAVEQALGEGEVPVPYQEVIRNYFR